MAAAGPLTPGTQSGWTNSSNVTASDNTYATNIVPGLDLGATLTLTNFGFAIPGDATIDGIQVNYEAKASAGSSVLGGYIDLLDLAGSTQNIDNNSVFLTTSDANYTAGSASDLWNVTPIAANINSSSFGVTLFFENTNASSRTVSIDLVTITVYYTESGGGGGARRRRLLLTRQIQ